MRRNFILTAFFYILALVSVFGQSVISGRVATRTGNGLSYVNIGIKGSETGAISSIDGRFSITIPDSLQNDSLSFSSIGFKDKSIAIASIAQKNKLEVVLDEKIISLTEVKITNTKRKLYKLGITGRTPMVYIPTRGYQREDIFEQARLIHLKKPAQIHNANIFILSDSKKEVNIRINFYAVENGMPGKRLVEKTIIKKTIVQKGWFTVDLEDEAIYLDEDFVVSFEYLPSDQASVVFGAKIGAADSFFRSNSQGLWRKNTLGGCTIYVTVAM